MMRGAIAAGLILAGSTPAFAKPELGPAWGDHMVIQQHRPIVIEGRADAGESVAATFGDETGTAVADAEGRFSISLPAREASGEPVGLVVSDASGSVTLDDILIGDVWLCSGQSNMELSVGRALDTYNQLRLAPDPHIRLLMVPQDTAPVPRTEFAADVAWAPATAQTVEPFSAACFYMGKDLRRDLEVPVGLIHSNWGGSAARAWLSPEGVEALYGKDAVEQLALYARDPLAAAQAFVPQWYDWWRSHSGGREPWIHSDTLAWQPVPRISFWNEWKGTGLDTQPQANVWLRKTFTLTPEQAAQKGHLNIGAIDDLDLTWVNGRPVGYTFGWGVERNYRVPADYLKAGENEVLIAANNMWDTGGFFAGPDRLFFTPASGETMPLGEGWEFAPSDVRDVPPRAPWDANAGMGVMHNAMIAPLGRMELKGVAWYQGESDVGQAGYADRLRELFAGWRRQFGDQARMLVVQLANYDKPAATPVASAWADLREQQRLAVLADRDAALVTAIDLGERTDIHPANKNELGKRLALAARGIALPQPTAARRTDDHIVLQFSGVSGALEAWSGPYPLALELCSDTQASCRYALARIDGDRLVLPDDGQPATRIRYAWADAPVVNLYDARQQTPPSFEIPIEDE